MSLEKAYEIYQQYKRTKKQVDYIQYMYEEGMTTNFEINALTTEPGFVEAAYELLDHVKEFVKLIEEADPNLDPETTKLEGVDDLFKGHFVTDHMNNVFNEVYNSQGVPANALGEGADKPCPCDDEGKEEDKISYRYEGYCWCGFLKKLQKEKKTIATCGISQRTLESIEMTRDPDGNCAACKGKPCCDECTDPCPCEGKQPEIQEVKCLVEGECTYPLCICAIGK